ncbi:hypothetical protein OAK38_06060 [Verrucomicrobia bacterium]|nr:hypothetical protein [Verrucomicrobiota bacterium]
MKPPNKKQPPKQPLTTRLRALGHELGMAELYGSHKDLTNKKRAHQSMLRAHYSGRGK